MNNEVVIPDTVEKPKVKKSLAVAAKEVLQPAMGEILKALPSSLKPEKFEAAFITAVINNPDILQCTPGSLRASLLKAAADGQMPDGRHAALVPHFNSKKGTKEATYMPMVRGIINKAASLGGVNSITAEVVCANDTFEANLADPADTIHKFPGFGMDRGDVVGAYAMFRTKDGQVVHREMMTKDEIEKTRNVSKMKNGSVWQKWYTEMCRKTVIRRGSKYVAMAPELVQVIERDDDHVTFEKEEDPNYNPLKDDLTEVIEGHAEEVPEVPDEDLNMGTEMCASIDAIEELSDLREWQEIWSDTIGALHSHVRKEVLDTINIRTKQLENADG
jgi:phage RecT family recombinase